MLNDVLIGLMVGLSLGLTGGGGSIFAVPLLIYVAGLSLQDAVPLSLMTVAATSLFGLLLSLRAGVIAWRAGLVFSLGGIVASPLGKWLAATLSEPVRLTSFAVLMLLIGASMWRKASRDPEAASIVRGNADSAGGSGAVCRLSSSGELRFTAPCALVLSVSGAVVGVLAGVFGVGGGFLIVPALIFVTQMTAQAAVATSLLSISIIGAAAAVSAILADATIVLENESLALLFLVGSLLGMTGGRFLAREIAGPILQKLFAAMVVTTALGLLVTR